ncbi:phosphomannomutase [uncultured Cohaesibacter sp.]|uniref:phosphomannomutase n=1 Tax=uncultured Cohaesibacter sp. TaxID=1002546 RepID=UPI0029308805|nr:phosphomannomutase [uncultured Cohaesibacter sp.]
MTVRFGTSGLRGPAKELCGQTTSLYVAAFCEMLRQRQLASRGDPIFLAEDLRPSSPDIAALCIGAISNAGFMPVFCGAIPTPALAHHAMLKKSAALMITGSHIPEDLNGIKFYLPDGEISKQDEQEMSALADRLAGTILPETARAACDGGAAHRAFLDRAMSLLPDNALSGLRIGLYEHSTVGCDLLREILAGYGADIVPLERAATFVALDTEALPPDMVTRLEGWCRDHRLDAIVSADGDADRPLVASEHGTPLRGDLLGLITARFLKADVIVTPVTSNSGLEREGGASIVRTRVGSPFVIAGMRDAIREGRTGVVGFEANGGFLTASAFPLAQGMLAPLPTRDSILPILAVLFSTRQSGKSLSSLAASFSLPVTDSGRVQQISQEQGHALVRHLRASEQNLSRFLSSMGKVQSTRDLDGLRVTLEDGRIIHFRPSGNAPEMRCYVEAASPTEAARTLEQGLALIRTFVEG